MKPPERIRRLPLPIETPRLTLRLPSLRDVPDLKRSFRDARTARAVGAPLHPLAERRDPKRMVARTLAEFRRGEHLSLTILERASARCVGRLGLRGLDWRWGKVESLSYWIDPSVWNRGYATEASYFLCAGAFRYLGMRRIASQALAPNRASLAVLRRLGFVQEGLERRSVRVHGVDMDMVLFGLLKDELPSRSSMVEVWTRSTRVESAAPGRPRSAR